MSRFRRCCPEAVLAMLFVATPCNGESNRTANFLASIRNNRHARMNFAYEFVRESPLLSSPLKQAYHVETQFADQFSRLTELRPHPDNGRFRVRSDSVMRGSARLNVTTSVTVEDPTQPHPSEFVGVLLSSKAISSVTPQPEDLESPSFLLSQARYNLALGVVLGAPLERYLGDPSDRRSEQTPGGERCVAVTKYGRCELVWADANDIYPQQLTLQVAENDLVGEQTLGDVSMGGGKGWPAGGLREVTSEIRDVRVKLFGEAVVPISWRCVDTYVCEDGTTVIERCLVQVVSVEFDAEPEEAGVLPVVLPKGIRVTVADAPHLNYAWDGDWAVPTVELLSQVDPHDDTRRQILLIVNVAAICVLLFLFVYLRRKPRTRSS